MAAYDKINIVWIDDNERIEGLPELSLGEMEPFFRVVHPAAFSEGKHTGKLVPFRRPEEFAEALRGFWFDHDRQVLPAEIVVMDYNLKKLHKLTAEDESLDVTEDRQKLRWQAQGADRTPPTQAVSANPEFEEGGLAGQSINFDGLLLGVFYASMAHEHPAGLVPMTHYIHEMPAAVHTLHAISNPFLEVDFQYIGAESRSWKHLLRKGVYHFRERLQHLYDRGSVHLSLDDLVELAASGKHPVLQVTSKYATRRVPIQGLFIDKEGTWSTEASDWASRLLRRRMQQCEQEREDQPDLAEWVSVLREGLKAAKELWNAYLDVDTDQSLTARRARLAHMIAMGDDTCRHTDDFKALVGLFGADLANDRCTKHCIEIRDYDQRTHRWIAMFLFVRFLQHAMRGRRAWQAKCEAEGWEAIMSCLNLGVDHKEMYLTTFPRAGTPLVPPAEPSSHAWGNHLRRHAISPGAFLLGGRISGAERALLRDYAAGIGFSKAEWSSDRDASRVLGDPSEAGI